MEIPQGISPDNIEIIPASREQEPVLANLLELYIYDFSEIIDLKLGENGRFGYESISLYWEDSSRHPFLIKADGHLAGFVLLRKGSQISRNNDVWDVTEFFIVRGSRRLGVGMEVAHKVWKQFSGKWEVRVRNKNQRAMEFWAHTVSEYLGKTTHPTPLEMNGEGWHVFSFES